MSDKTPLWTEEPEWPKAYVRWLRETGIISLDGEVAGSSDSRIGV